MPAGGLPSEILHRRRRWPAAGMPAVPARLEQASVPRRMDRLGRPAVQPAAGAGGLQLEVPDPAAGAGGESGEPCAVAVGGAAGGRLAGALAGAPGAGRDVRGRADPRGRELPRRGLGACRPQRGRPQQGQGAQGRVSEGAAGRCESGPAPRAAHAQEKGRGARAGGGRRAVRRAVARLCRHRGRDGRGPRCRLAGAAAHDRHAAGGAVRVPAFSHNRQSYQITLNELWDQCRLLGVPLPQEHPAAASAMCAARMKVGAEAFAECRRRIVERLGDEQVERWRGRRLFAVDGTKINVPRELLEDGCSLPSPGARYPQGLCSCLYRLNDRMPIDFELSARLCERSLAATHLPRLSAGDVAACDRGCYSFELLWDHVRRNVDCANRLQRSSAAQFERFIESGESECIVRALPGKDARRKWRRSHPGEPPPPPVAVRWARIETGGEDFFIAATPADAERLPLPAIGDIYRGRWGIEELCKVSKQLAEVEQFHARTGRGVRQELFAHSAIVALTRSLGNFAEQAVGACADDGAAVQANFKNALATVARQLEAAVLGHARLAAEAVSNMVEGIASCTGKTRPGRSYPRVSKRPDDRFRNPNRKSGKAALPAA